jgi:hypothetical protein
MGARLGKTEKLRSVPSQGGYGELKVTRSGHSVLVGLRDADLIALR